MSENQSPLSEYSLTIPAFQKSSELSLNLTHTREAEKRIIEAKTVNPITYCELESCYNEAYRELKGHLAKIGFELSKAENALETAKSTFLIDTYPDLIKDRAKSMDSADLRKAYLMRDPEYVAAKERQDQLKAMEALLDSKIKVFERVCVFMRKRMDLILRSGLTNDKLYK